MPRLLIHVEGQTEESFVNEILRPHLVETGFERVDARLLGNSRARNRRGGITGWQNSSREIGRHLMGDTGAFATTFVDFYALPQNGVEGWPGRATVFTHDLGAANEYLIEMMHNAFAEQFEYSISRRFVPFVAFHEFEGLLFSDPNAMSRGIGYPELAPNFSSIRAQFDTPEHINDSPQTAPSKRIEALVPGYEKPFHGVLAALEVSLEAMRLQCPCFDNWITRLESVPDRF